MATASRAAAHSRSTAASMSSLSRGIEPGPLPLADILEHRALLDVPVMDRRRAHGVEAVAAGAAGQHRERYRLDRRPRGGGADVARPLAEQLGRDGGGIGLCGAALVGAGARQGVALDVLDRAQAGVHGAAQVGDGDVAVQVDVGRGLLAGEQPARRHLGQSLAGRRTDHPLAGQRAVWHEARPAVVPAHRAAAVAVQVEHRVEAAGDAEHVALHPLGVGGHVDRGDQHRRQPAGAGLRADDGASPAQIDHDRVERPGDVQPGVVVGEHRRPLGGDCEPLAVRAQRRPPASRPAGRCRGTRAAVRRRRWRSRPRRRARATPAGARGTAAGRAPRSCRHSCRPRSSGSSSRRPGRRRRPTGRKSRSADEHPRHLVAGRLAGRPPVPGRSGTDHQHSQWAWRRS